MDLSIDEAIVTFTKDYIEDVQRRHNWVGQQIQEVIMLPFNIAAYTILLYATKYIFFFFASARYLYLILLEIVTPIAVILYMDEKTRHYTHAYLKNLFVCYMTIPAFLIANALGLSLRRISCTCADRTNIPCWDFFSLSCSNFSCLPKA